MIFSLLIIHIHERMSSITRVLHTTTWDYFTFYLPDRFLHSPKAVIEVIMTDINDLVQEFRRTSSDGVVRASFFAMRILFVILQDILEVCFDIFAAAVYLADNNLQVSAKPSYMSGRIFFGLPIRFGAKFKKLFDEYRKMFDQLLSKSKDLADMLRLLPGVVVQKHMSMEGMAHLYRIKPELLERLIKFTMEPLKPSPPHYILDGYMSGFLRDQDRSQLYYCDPMLQHISICRHVLTLLDGSNAFDLQS